MVVVLLLWMISGSTCYIRVKRAKGFERNKDVPNSYLRPNLWSRPRDKNAIVFKGVWVYHVIYIKRKLQNIFWHVFSIA